MNTDTPISPKVTVAALAGALTTILVYLIDLTASVEIPGAVAAAITLVIMGGAGYVKRDPLRGPARHAAE